MKRFELMIFAGAAVFLIMVGAALRVHAEPRYTVTMTNAVDKIAPNRQTKNGIAFSAGAGVAQGTYITNSVSKVYMALTAGTNGVSEPTHGSGTNTSGSIIYYRVQEKPRKSLILSNVSTNTHWWTMYSPAAGDKPGAAITVNGVVSFDADFQGEVYAGTNGVISVQEL